MRARPVTDRLRSAVKEAERDGMTAWAISDRAGMGLSALKRFRDGECGITLDTAVRLAKVVGHRLGGPGDE